MGGSRANYFAQDAASVRNGSGSGMATFGDTKAYQDLMDAYYSGGTAELNNNNGILSWWTKSTDALYGEYNMLKLKASGLANDWYNIGGKANWFFGAGATLSGIAGGLNAERMYGEGLSYNAKTGSKLYIGTARPNSPINLGFTKFYGNGRTYINPVYMGKAGNILGKASIAGTVIIGGVNIYNGIQQDGGSFGHNAAVATGGTVGGAIGAYEGAILGAEIGAGIGVWAGGIGAAPGALIGGIVGGVIGGIVGTKVGENVVYY